MAILTPNDPDFDGVGDGCFEEALFLVKADGGQRAIVDVHLCDCDEESPSGYGWDFTVYKWDGNCWIDWDGGLYWDYASADTMTDFDLPAGFANARVKLVQPGSQWTNLDALTDPPRMFKEWEWRNAADIGPAPAAVRYPLTQDGLDLLVENYSGTDMAEAIEDVIREFHGDIEDYAWEEAEDSGQTVPDDATTGSLLALLYAPGLGYPTSVLDTVNGFEEDIEEILADDPWFECSQEEGRLFDHWVQP